MNRFIFLGILLASCGNREHGTPFVADVTPELKARLQAECRVAGYEPRPPIEIGSSGDACQVILTVGRDGRIMQVDLADKDDSRFRQRVDALILPLLEPAAARAVTKVLEKRAPEGSLHAPLPGDGNLDFYWSLPSLGDRQTLHLTIARN